MHEQDAGNSASFDQHARSYEQQHAAAIRASGESTTYFAEYKLKCLERMGEKAPVLDFGCGIGNLTEQLVKAYREVHGYDPSSESLRLAKPRANGAMFSHDLGAVPDATFQTAVLAGVLHHVPPAERVALLGYVKRTFAPGGNVVEFVNNPLNPATRHSVTPCPFADDPILLCRCQ